MQTWSTLSRISTTLFIAWMVSFAFAPAATRADECPIKLPKEFKAVVEMHSAGAPMPQQDIKATVYVKDLNVRMESNMICSLMLGSEGKSYIFNHEKKQYAETPFSNEAVNILKGEFPPGLQWTKVGTEEVNGKQCDQYSVQFPGAPAQVDTKLSIDSTTKYPTQLTVSVNNPGGPSINMVTSIAITEGEQAQSLFALPAGYQSVDTASLAPGVAPANPEKTPE